MNELNFLCIIYKITEIFYVSSIIILEMPSFYVVKFIDEGDVYEVIPESWLIGRDSCIWPRVTSTELTKMLSADKGREDYCCNWKDLNISICAQKGKH